MCRGETTPECPPRRGAGAKTRVVSGRQALQEFAHVWNKGELDEAVESARDVTSHLHKIFTQVVNEQGGLGWGDQARTIEVSRSAMGCEYEPAWGRA